jgi:hypothetical protein
MRDCQRLLGAPYESVNRWIDEFFGAHGPQHRKYRHHREGIEEARALFGDEGAKAAAVHILRDCRNIPTQEDYSTGAADALGLKKQWPVSAYIHYTEEAFNTLVKFTLEGPTAVILSAFFRTPTDLEQLLSALARLSSEQIHEHLRAWPQAQARFNELSLHPLGPATTREPDGKTAEYCLEAKNSLAPLMAQIPQSRFAMVPVDQLITPLTLIDYEYVEELKADLTGTEPEAIARFALPLVITVQGKTAIDPSGRAINFISSQKTLALGPITVSPIPGVGLEVKLSIVGTPQLITVGRIGERLYLRSGIHRAYLLASMGIKEIPCILRDENQVPLTLSAYPAFAPHVLALPRPPLLQDTFDPTLTLHVPLIRTNKVFRISAEELVLPVS